MGASTSAAQIRVQSVTPLGGDCSTGSTP
jgi:hypothetical protein